ncbi:hypothetical protein HMPREF9439_02161 [Parasutterella excrementihominis YIT 11859]|uniref:Uncharacterized protein n=1 Tax=Parasutterella excrementihominis YIT 11859 TaxID=762966 RepID=F3QMI2_9BURK|nr:hypothetical protein HMPREF9439_02161 [Parasutterella excrementihominis YIT 11859]
MKASPTRLGRCKKKTSGFGGQFIQALEKSATSKSTNFEERS